MPAEGLFLLLPPCVLLCRGFVFCGGSSINRYRGVCEWCAWLSMRVSCAAVTRGHCCGVRRSAGVAVVSLPPFFLPNEWFSALIRRMSGPAAFLFFSLVVLSHPMPFSSPP